MFALEKPVCREKTRLTGLEAPDVAASKAWRDSGRAPSLSRSKRREKGILLGSFYVSVKLPNRRKMKRTVLVACPVVKLFSHQLTSPLTKMTYLLRFYSYFCFP